MIVGLTGGIGSGKTTVGKMFCELGVPVYNSDDEAKRLMESSSEVKKAVKKLLGKEAYLGKRLNKIYISKLIFKNENLLAAINSIVHPAVRMDFLSWSKRQKYPYVIQEAAIIFEIGSQDLYDKIILVTAPSKMRLDRIMARDKASSKKSIKARMENQWDDSTKKAASHYVIENLDIELTRAEVLAVHHALLDHS